ncbi:unnamed protein product [Cuscuta campestris]|uniref:ACT domain-containing protein n=1 Tax=Cuscuta campestris TaxID=132261 RepID=A0A484LMR1_9ASTE|nr:unnamed protein product [Cuscuta campestris]
MMVMASLSNLIMMVSIPLFLAIASPPSLSAAKGVLEFLVKSVPGSIAKLLCKLQKVDVVELSSAMGKGFEIDLIPLP